MFIVIIVAIVSPMKSLAGVSIVYAIHLHPVASQAISVVMDAVFLMFMPDMGGIMLVAVQTRVLPVVAVGVAGIARGCMAAGKGEIFVMVKGCWFPFLC